MTELAAAFSILPPPYQRLVVHSQDENSIVVTPLQQLKGGLSGAYIFLASVSPVSSSDVEHLVLKLDRPYPGKRNEVARHHIASRQSPPLFARSHMPDIAYQPVEFDGLIAVFYRVAGESLLQYHPLAALELQPQLQTIFERVSTDLLAEWNSQANHEVAAPQSLLAHWLTYRLDTGNRIERFLREDQDLDADVPGLLLGDIVYPNPLFYARTTHLWEGTRSLDAMFGFQHGDLNTNNILVRFDAEGREIDGYFFIDFAFFEERAPLLFDHAYLELAYLIRYLENIPLATWIKFIARLSQQDFVDLHQIPVELAGLALVTGSARRAFEQWSQSTRRSLADDLWGQFWLAAAAVGLNFCNKSGLHRRERLAALIYAAVHMKRFCIAFGVPLPSETSPINIADHAPKAPPVRRALNISGNLSRSLESLIDPFVGRELELNNLVGILTDSDSHLVTVTGPGGVGKTHLALKATSKIASSFAHGASFVPLAHLDSADQIAQSIAESLNFPLTAPEKPESQLIDHLRYREILLVLDNFEHVLDGVDLLANMLISAPGVTLLVTSRQRLNLRGETVFQLSGMSVKRWNSLEEALTDNPVQLFLLGARRAKADFALSAEDLDHLARILQLTEALPLGILLAAGWVNLLALKDIADEIDSSLDFLETDLRDVPARQRSLRAVFDSTWHQMSTEEKKLLKKLSPFRAGFTRQAAQHVAGAELPDLASLINSSIVRKEYVSGRFSIHELLRQYVEEKLRASPKNLLLVQSTHANYYAELTNAKWKDLTSEKQKSALFEMVDDIENVRAAWRHVLKKFHLKDLGKFLDTLWMVYDVMGWYQAADTLFGEAAALVRPQISESDLELANIVLAQLLARQGYFSGLLGNPEKGLGMAQESVSILKRSDRPGDLLLPLIALNMNAVFLDDFTSVGEDSQEVLETVQAERDRWGEGMILTWMASRALANQEYRAARLLAGRSSAIFEELGESWGLSWSSGVVLGSVAIAQGEYTEARMRYQRGLDAAMEIGYRRAIQYANNNLGHVALLLGDPSEAETYYLQSLKISEEIGQKREMVETVFDLAKIQAAQGNKEKAVRMTALVLDHPASSQQTLFGRRNLQHEARHLLNAVQKDFEPDSYEAALYSDKYADIEAAVMDLLQDSERKPAVVLDNH